MLAGKQVRVRHARDRIIPFYIPLDDAWVEVAGRLLDLFRGQEGRARGELEEELKQSFAADPKQLVHQGLAKLLEDRYQTIKDFGIDLRRLKQFLETGEVTSSASPSGRASESPTEQAL